MRHANWRALPYRTALVLITGVVTGCANLADTPAGTPLTEVEAQYGAPNYRCTTQQGQDRVVWTGQPFGQYAWASNLDAAGNTIKIEPVLTDAQFRLLDKGQWDKERVSCHFGPPAEVSHVGLPAVRQEVWSYRYRENSVWNSLMHIYFDSTSGLVNRRHAGPDPMYERDNLWLFN